MYIKIATTFYKVCNMYPCTMYYVQSRSSLIRAQWFGNCQTVHNPRMYSYGTRNCARCKFCDSGHAPRLDRLDYLCTVYTLDPGGGVSFPKSAKAIL